MVKMLVFDLRPSEREYFEKRNRSDFEITFFKESLNEETKLTVKECEETVILSIFISSKITENVLSRFKNLRIISTRSHEYDHIDLEACRKRNIAVINVNDFARSAVAQYVIALMFALTRNIVSASRDIREKRVSYQKYEGVDVRKLSIGVIGTGSVGGEVCKLAHNIGMNIFANDVRVNNEIKDFVEYVSFSDLLRKSDVITIHIPYIKEFHHMISYKEFEIMKEKALIINTANGGFINVMALYEAIKNNKLKGAALDMIECNEWRNNTQEFSNILHDSSYECLENTVMASELMECDNVIITPRIAYNTVETTEKILQTSLEDIMDCFKGRCINRVV